MGTGTGARIETTAVADMGMGKRGGGGGGGEEGRGRGTWRRGEEAQEIRYFHSARVVISADKGWRLQTPDNFVCKARCLYTHIATAG